LATRELRELTQAQLAEKAGIPAGTISHFETGLRKSSFDNLVKLAEALAVKIDFLLGRETEPTGAGEEIAALFRDISKVSDADRAVLRTIVDAQKKQKGS
jgi:transcriptional regulator with XRE-family HTH domain